jgi:hypothetical protein
MNRYKFYINLFGKPQELIVTAASESDARGLIKTSMIQSATEAKLKSKESIPEGVMLHVKTI